MVQFTLFPKRNATFCILSFGGDCSKEVVSLESPIWFFDNSY